MSKIEVDEEQYDLLLHNLVQAQAENIELKAILQSYEQIFNQYLTYEYSIKKQLREVTELYKRAHISFATYGDEEQAWIKGYNQAKSEGE